jgi:F-type H+-transporting ATPase subunit d
MSAKGSLGRAIDWDQISKVVVTEAGKRQLQALRNAYEDVATTINDTFNMVYYLTLLHNQL